MLVTSDTVSLSLEFHREKVNTGELQTGQICTMFVPVKSSHVVVVSLLSAMRISAVGGETYITVQAGNLHNYIKLKSHSSVCIPLASNDFLAS